MRLMSVALTEKPVRDRTKTVTRRLGWQFAKPGDRVTLCRKVMGRKKGEPLVRICNVEIVDVRRERLDAITADEVTLEGFPSWTVHDFIIMFMRSMKCGHTTEVTRIEWRYLTMAVDVDDALDICNPVWCFRCQAGEHWSCHGCRCELCTAANAIAGDTGYA